MLDKAELSYKIEYFEKKYFESLRGYNQLLLSCDFYKRFSNDEYMLIYQLDAYVFRDELDYWCQKWYDYIGAPWFNDNKSFEDNAQLWSVGNGGFSLRRVSRFIEILNSRRNVFTLKQLIKRFLNKRLSLPVFINMYFFGFENRIRYLTNNWTDAEDLFFCLVLDGTRLKLKKPAVYDAVPFSFECSPEYLYSLNGNKLPFGCHGWHNYNFEGFWTRHIKEYRN